MDWLSFQPVVVGDDGVGMIEVPEKKLEGLRGGDKIYLFRIQDDGHSTPYAVLTFTRRAASSREGFQFIGGPYLGYEQIPSEIKPDTLRKFDLGQFRQEWNFGRTKQGFVKVKGQFKIGPGELTDDTPCTREISRELTNLNAIRARDRWKGSRRRR
ncbi:MAG TPA: hypothetical protein PKV94_07725 [Syntrophales bacterium]|nr:hypothetical protein [Syntrophales bacterium]HPN24878.1 hypothetical protein [Syntrophales bacterium]